MPHTTEIEAMRLFRIAVDIESSALSLEDRDFLECAAMNAGLPVAKYADNLLAFFVDTIARSSGIAPELIVRTRSDDGTCGFCSIRSDLRVSFPSQ